MTEVNMANKESRPTVPRQNTPAEPDGSQNEISQACLNLSDLIILSLNTKGIIVDINKTGVRLLGGETKTDIIGLNWFDRFLPESEKSELKSIFEKIHTDTEQEISHFESPNNQILTLSGEKRDISWQNRVIRNEDGNPTLVISVGNDVTDLATAKSKLLVSEQKFQYMVETAHDLTIVADIDGTVNYVSPQVKRYGYEQTDLEGHSFLEFVHPDNHEELINDIKLILQTTDTHFKPTDIRGKKKNGDWVWFSLISGAIRDDDGKPTGITSVLRDIQESKIAQEKIEQERNKYEILFESALDGFVTLNRDHFLDCNPATLKIFGFDSKSELIGFHPAKLSPPTQPNGRSSKEEADRHIDEGYKFGKVSFEWVYRKKDGTLINCSIQLNRTVVDEQIILHGILRDRTEELEQAKKISESESLYRTLVESNPYYIKLITVDGAIVSMNRAALEHHGYENLEAAKNDSSASVFCADTKGTAVEAIKKAKKGVTTTVKLNIMNDTEEAVPFRVTFAPVKDTADTVDSILIIGADLSEMKALEQKVSELDQIKSSLTTGLTRVMRSPLNKIAWALKILMSGEAAKLSANQTVFVRQAIQSNDELLDLLDAINLSLDIERGTLNLEKKYASLESVVQSAITKFKIRLSLDKISYSLEKPSNPVNLEIDAVKLSMAIQSLVDNAVRYQGEDNRSIKIKIIDLPKKVRCEIQDTGIGIPSNERKNVFGLFQRASNAFSRHPDGLGIGLYNAESVIEAHDGKIGFTSEENHGSTFWFELPKQ